MLEALGAETLSYIVLALITCAVVAVSCSYYYRKGRAVFYSIVAAGLLLLGGMYVDYTLRCLKEEIDASGYASINSFLNALSHDDKEKFEVVLKEYLQDGKISRCELKKINVYIGKRKSLSDIIRLEEKSQLRISVMGD
tara:strand:+ start:668 stop:1084 length:417 start_codon:yes stop_codon:yes gene_type:complete